MGFRTAAAIDDGWLIGGSTGDVAEFADGATVDGNGTENPGRGVIVELTEDLQLDRVDAIGGDAGSSVARIIPEQDGFVALGDFGFERDHDAVFGEENPVTLTSISSDDDPGFDIFVAAWDGDRKLRFARRIQNLSISPRNYPWFIRTSDQYGIPIREGVEPELRNGEIATGYPVLDELDREREPGPVAVWLTHDGEFADGYRSRWAWGTSFDPSPAERYSTLQVVDAGSPYLEAVDATLQDGESGLLATRHSRPGENVRGELFEVSTEPASGSVDLCGTRQDSQGDLLACLIVDGKRLTIPGEEFGVEVPEGETASDIPALTEPFFLTFDADIEMHVCMTPEDVGEAGLDELGQKWA